MRAPVNLKQEVTLISLIQGSDRMELKTGFSTLTVRLQQIANQELAQATFKVAHLGTPSHSKFLLTFQQVMWAHFHITRNFKDLMYPLLLFISNRTFSASTIQALHTQWSKLTTKRVAKLSRNLWVKTVSTCSPCIKSLPRSFSSTCRLRACPESKPSTECLRRLSNTKIVHYRSSLGHQVSSQVIPRLMLSSGNSPGWIKTTWSRLCSSRRRLTLS